MREMDRYLKENIEDYESVKRSALKYIKENGEELKKRYPYSKELEKDIQENKILFVWDSKTGRSGELPYKMFQYVEHTYGKQYDCICCQKGSMKLTSGGNSVKHDSPGFWEAAASAAYIVSSIPFPVAFVKRKGQKYFYTGSQLWEKDNRMDVEGVSMLAREILKADYILAQDEKTAVKGLKEDTRLAGIYEGKVLVCQDPEHAVGELTELLLGKEDGSQKVSVLSLRERARKKLLVLTSWKDSREHKFITRQLLNRLQEKDMDTVILSSWTADEEEFRDFVSGEDGLVRVMYRGRMTMDEEDFLFYRCMEKNPDVYKSCAPAKEHMDLLMEREWHRIWGSQTFDTCLVLGSQGYQQYYMAMTCPAKEKILVDLDFLPVLKEKDSGKWIKGLSLFDQIFYPAVIPGTGGYGMENQGKVRPLPVMIQQQQTNGELVELDGRKYLVCDSVKDKNNSMDVKLMLYPEDGSILVNADLAPDEAVKEKLNKVKGRIYLLGPCAQSYRLFLKDAIVLDEYVRNILYLLPVAGFYWKQFKAYVPAADTKSDPLGEICRLFGVETL